MRIPIIVLSIARMVVSEDCCRQLDLRLEMLQIYISQRPGDLELKREGYTLSPIRVGKSCSLVMIAKSIEIFVSLFHLKIGHRHSENTNPRCKS